MASHASSPGAADAAFADFAAMAGLDLVGATSPTTPTASSLQAAPVTGAGSMAVQPLSGPPAEEIAELPVLGTPAVVEPPAGEEDVAPPVMGVPVTSSPEDRGRLDEAYLVAVDQPLVDVALEHLMVAIEVRDITIGVYGGLVLIGAAASLFTFSVMERVGRFATAPATSKRRADNAWDKFTGSLHEPGAKMLNWELPYSVRQWVADSSPEAEVLEARIAVRLGRPSWLKEAFPLDALEAFDPRRASHSVDVFVIALWFILREIEVAAARVVSVVPLHRQRQGANAIRHLSRGFVLLLDGHVFYDFGVIRAEHLAPFAARRLSPYWIAFIIFIDNVEGQFAVMTGYGKDPSVNGILASFWGLPPTGKDSRARAEGWTRVTTPVDDNMEVFARAAVDIDFACHAVRLAGRKIALRPERVFKVSIFVIRPAPAHSAGVRQAAVYPSRVTARPGSQGRASVNDFPPQAQPSGVAEAAAALAAALAPLAEAAPVQAGEERKRRRYRHKAPPPQECTPISTRPQSPCSASTGRKHGFGLSHAEVLAETATAAIGLSLERLSEDIGKICQERATRRAACQQAASEALHLLDKHRPACRESCDALGGAVKAADAALAAVAALERLHAPDVQNRLSTCPLPSQPLQVFGGSCGGLGAPGPLRKRVRRIDGIAA
ncbi:hypothetical protein AK812_SmicGene27796 [Symbiodinium microadriaticum]|uniref:Uncharacterized protein n=1 Tax=Symbiodinium microadriaticum TaxID=2951 RepID=A0A1Q9D5Z2_SYMMI|nr:hypothetical protein AK812_SmicGene27796 [Symbiodinium microadriaticum]